MTMPENAILQNMKIHDKRGRKQYKPDDKKGFRDLFKIQAHNMHDVNLGTSTIQPVPNKLIMDNVQKKFYSGMNHVNYNLRLKSYV